MYIANMVGKPITLRDVKTNGNRFCGPAAISAVTGIGTAEASKLIRSINGKANVMGTGTWEMREALKKMGISMRPTSWQLPGGKKPTLAAWLREYKGVRTWGRTFLIVAGNHWQIISGRRYVCGITKKVVSIRDEKVRRRAQVTDAYELIKIGKPDPEVNKLWVTEKKVSNPDTRKARTIAKKYGIELDPWTIAKKYGIELDPWDTKNNEYWVNPPDKLDVVTADPYEDDHLGIGWDNVLERCQAYAKLCEEHSIALEIARENDD